MSSKYFSDFSAKSLEPRLYKHFSDFDRYIPTGLMVMADELKKGDKVEWHSPGTIEGTVKKKLTEPIDIKGHHVAASKANPEYLVESDKTGKEAAHKPESLKRVED